MAEQKSGNTETWQALAKQAEIINQPKNHLKNLLADPARLSDFSVYASEILFDYSRQRVTQPVMDLLFDLAMERRLPDKFNRMVSGEKINNTEGRAALHTANRNFTAGPVLVGKENILPEIAEQRELMNVFSKKIRSGELTGSTGKKFKHIVVVGIGGSYLGTEFVSTALSAHADKSIRLHYLSNVDIHNFGHVANEIDPETTLWVVVSKSYTTTETLANANLAKKFIVDKGLDPKKPHGVCHQQRQPG